MHACVVAIKDLPDCEWMLSCSYFRVHGLIRFLPAKRFSCNKVNNIELIESGDGHGINLCICALSDDHHTGQL